MYQSFICSFVILPQGAVVVAAVVVLVVAVDPAVVAVPGQTSKQQLNLVYLKKIFLI